MSKNSRQSAPQDRSASEFYRLHTQAVDDLIHANAENSPPVPEEELRKYRSGLSKYKASDWVKVLFAKFWFPAAVCYYMVWGLSTYISATLDLLFVTGIALGIVTDLLTNNLLRYFAETEGANDIWMMFPKKKYWTFPLNILYAWLVLFVVFMLYGLINGLGHALGAAEDAVVLGVEPILFGLFYVIADLLFLGAKHLFIRILSDARRKENG